MYGVLSHSIDKVWPEVSVLLAPAVLYSDGKYEVEDVYKSLTERDMQLWVAFKNKGLCATCVTQIINYPRKKVMFLLFIAGIQSINWLHLADDLAQFAREHGCQSVEGYGRPGWEKLGVPFGFKKIHTIFRLDLAN